MMIKPLISLLAGSGLSILVVWLLAWSVKKTILFKKPQNISNLAGRLAVSGLLVILIFKYLKPDIFPFFLGFFIAYFLTVWIMSIKCFKGDGMWKS